MYFQSLPSCYIDYSLGFYYYKMLIAVMDGVGVWSNARSNVNAAFSAMYAGFICLFSLSIMLVNEIVDQKVLQTSLF